MVKLCSWMGIWMVPGVLMAQHAGRAPGWVDPPSNLRFAPFSMQWSKSEESMVDLSGFLEAPAGKDGFIKVRDGHLVRPDGRRFRIWGMNFGADDCFPPKALAPAIAEDLARLGFNYVRMHHMDAGFGPVSLFLDEAEHTRVLDSERLDRLDYFVAELKKRGIYVNFNLNNSRRFRGGDGVRDFRSLKSGKCATYFNPRLIELQHEYARNLLDRVNLYTGNTYRDEPALAAVEMVNENSMIEGWLMERIHGPNPDGRAMFGALPVSYATELTVLFNQWLAENRPDSVRAALREESGTPEGELIPRLRPDEFQAASEARFRAEAAFYVAVEQEFFDDFTRVLRDEIGLRCLIVGPADHNDGIATLPHLKTMAKRFSYMEGHGYWEHPKLEKPQWVRNSPMVNDPLDSSYNQFARTPVKGMPFVFGETSAPYPGDYGPEVFPILAAYACHQDWDGACWFFYGDGRKLGDSPPIENLFALGNDPARMASIAAAGALFHRADAAAARKMVVRGYDDETVIEALRWDRAAERPFFHRGYDLATALHHAVRLTFDPAQATALPSFEGVTDYVTDTGEIRWAGADRKRGLVTIDTARTQAAIGFVNDTAFELPHLDVELRNPFATVVLTSLDGAPIATADEMLLVVANRVRNEGMAFEDDHQTIRSLGDGPPRIEVIRGRVRISGLEGAQRVTVTALGAVGDPLVSIETGVDDGVAEIPVGEQVTVWWYLEVVR